MAPDGLNVIGDAYAGVAGRLAEADLNLGCGVPTRHAALRPGETVLDLGSGAGNDAFIARHEVGPEGRVLGVDMTAEMIAKARGNAAKLGYDNVEFREGPIEQMPVDAGSVDVVISNCVLNLVPDKGRAFAEMFRVLRPGGRFCVSDIVATGELPAPVREVAALYVGCVAGAMAEDRYLALLETTGFDDVRVAEAKPIAAVRRGARRQHERGRHRGVSRLRRRAQERHRARHQAGIVAFIRREAGASSSWAPGMKGCPTSRRGVCSVGVMCMGNGICGRTSCSTTRWWPRPCAEPASRPSAPWSRKR